MFLAEVELDMKKRAFESKAEFDKFNTVLNAVDKLELFFSTNPSMTRQQWGLLEDCFNRLKGLMK